MENYKITIPHFYCIKYEDFIEHKTMLLEVDLWDKYKIISPNCVKHWEPPYQDEIICDEKKDVIINNVFDYLVNQFGKRNVINYAQSESKILFFFKHPFYYLFCCFSNKKIKKLLDEKHGNSKKL